VWWIILNIKFSIFGYLCTKIAKIYLLLPKLGGKNKLPALVYQQIRGDMIEM